MYIRVKPEEDKVERRTRFGENPSYVARAL